MGLCPPQRSPSRTSSRSSRSRAPDTGQRGISMCPEYRARGGARPASEWGGGICATFEAGAMMPDAVIVDCLRTPVGKAARGALRDTRPDDLAATVLRALMKRYPQVPKEEVEDVILGCAMPEAE